MVNVAFFIVGNPTIVVGCIKVGVDFDGFSEASYGFIIAVRFRINYPLVAGLFSGFMSEGIRTS